MANFMIQGIGIKTPEPTSQQATPKLKVTKCLEFSAKRPDDVSRVYVTGALLVADKVVVLDIQNEALKLFDKKGNYITSVESKPSPWGITGINGNNFATCGDGKKVYLWSVCGQTIECSDVSYNVDHDAYGVQCNGTYFCVLHKYNNAITVLDDKGTQVRKIVISKAFGKTFEFGWDIHIDSETNNIYVACENRSGILCVAIDGTALWFTQLDDTYGIAEMHDTLCIADYVNGCIHLLTRQGCRIRVLLKKDDLGGNPAYLCYGHDGNLYVSHTSGSRRHDMISVYSVTKI